MIDFYAIFDKSNGMCMQICTAESKISADAVCTLDQIAIQVDGEFKQDAFYLSNTSLVPILAKPSPHHTFNWHTKQWEDPRTLQDLKDAKWATIKQARSASEYAGFTSDGSTFDSDAISQNRITGAVTLAQMSSTFSIDWVLADNTVRTLNQSDMLAVGAALGAHVAAIFAKGVLLREQIEAATTAEEVAGVVW